MLEYFTKTSREVLDYTVDHRRWLGDHEVIVGASAKIVPAEKIRITRVEFTDTEIVVWLFGGLLNHQYSITTSATTNQGRLKDERFLVSIVPPGYGDHDEFIIPQISISDSTVVVGVITP